jgi:hypothetical protein
LRRRQKVVGRVTYPYYTHDCLSEVSGIDGLHECIPVIYEGKEGHTGRGLSDPVQESILSSEHSGGPDDDLEEVITREMDYQNQQFEVIGVEE